MFGLQFSVPQLSSVKTSSLQKGTRLCAGIPPTTGLQEFHHLPFSSATVFSWAVCRPRPASASLLMELQSVHLGRLARSVLSWVFLPAASLRLMKLQRVRLGLLARSVLSWVVLPAACCPGSSCPQLASGRGAAG